MKVYNPCKPSALDIPRIGVNRRRFLHTTALTATCGVISGSYRTRPRATIPLTGNNCHLAPVLVSPDREIRTIVGLHNYGHGGGGITLSWGTPQIATELLPGEPLSAVSSGSVAAKNCLKIGVHSIGPKSEEMDFGIGGNALE